MSGTRLSASEAGALERCIASGGVAVFPADTVYGLACDPSSPSAIKRLYELKGRPERMPAAVMFFALRHALAALPELDPQTLAAARALLPGPVTLILSNPRNRFPLACDPASGAGPAEHAHAGASPPPLGLRVPRWPPELAALGEVRLPAMQSSANRSGEPAASALSEVPESIRRAADLVLDGGRLPGTASTVIDLRALQGEGAGGGLRVLREGALDREQIASALHGIQHGL